MKQWLQITVDVHDLPEHDRDIIALLVSEKCNGVEFVTEYNDSAGIRGYIPFGDDGRFLLSELKNEITQYAHNSDVEKLEPLGSRLSVETIEDVDWATTWKKYYKPTKIGRHFVIVPSWESYRELQPEDKILTLDPGQAFGTGHHASTRLCLRLLESLDIHQKRVADIGCGSGILAVAAALVRAEKIVACDIDEKSVRIARENARQNEVYTRIKFLHGSASDLNPESPFDLVMANMLFDILQRISQDLVNITRDGGDLIWSGIVDKQAGQVESLCKRLNVEIVRTLQEEEWIGFLLRKK